MLGINAQQIARAKVLVPRNAQFCDSVPMKDWAITYILHVLEAKDWSANRLATEAGVASSTINRPLRERDWPHKISRTTLTKIQEASGIDPSPFIPDGFSEDKSMFSGVRIRTVADRALDNLDKPQPAPNAQAVNEIKIAVVGPLAQIVATVNREGIARLRAKLDAIESMLDD